MAIWRNVRSEANEDGDFVETFYLYYFSRRTSISRRWSPPARGTLFNRIANEIMTVQTRHLVDSEEKSQAKTGRRQQEQRTEDCGSANLTVQVKSIELSDDRRKGIRFSFIYFLNWGQNPDLGQIVIIIILTGKERYRTTAQSANESGVTCKIRNDKAQNDKWMPSWGLLIKMDEGLLREWRLTEKRIERGLTYNINKWRTIVSIIDPTSQGLLHGGITLKNAI